MASSPWRMRLRWDSGTFEGKRGSIGPEPAPAGGAGSPSVRGSMPTSADPGCSRPAAPSIAQPFRTELRDDEQAVVEGVPFQVSATSPLPGAMIAPVTGLHDRPDGVLGDSTRIEVAPTTSTVAPWSRPVIERELGSSGPRGGPAHRSRGPPPGRTACRRRAAGRSPSARRASSRRGMSE